MTSVDVINGIPQGLSLARERLMRGAFTGLKRALIDLQGYIKLEKLQGQVLRHITGKLAQSVRVLPPTEGPQMEGYVVAGGGPAFYAAVQEFGGTDAYEIRPKSAKALAWPTAGGPMTTIQVAAAARWGRVHSMTAKERALGKGNLELAFAKAVHHPPLPQRSFMRTSLKERSTRSQELIAEGIRKAI